MQPSETAVVTGASSGIGEACARRLLDLGIGVVTLQRSAPKLQHPNLHFRKIDLADNDATRVLAREIAAEFPVRYLVNNAGANRPAPLEDATIDDMQYVTAVTLGAAMVLTQAFVPGMRAAKFGRIVNISSRAMGLIGMTRTVACEVGGDGVTVNTVIPGPVASELFTQGHPLGSEKRQRVIDSILVKRIGTPDDIARAVLFFLDRDAGYVTGQALFVCGGTSVTGTGGA